MHLVDLTLTVAANCARSFRGRDSLWWLDVVPIREFPL